MKMSLEEDSLVRMHENESASLPRMTIDDFASSIDPLAPDGHFAAHHHAADQLAWVGGGGMRVRVDDAHWRVTPAHFVWIPAHSEHEMWMEGADTLLNLYLAPMLRPSGERWARPLVLPVEDLTANIVRHLCEKQQSLSRQQHSWTLLRDILEHTVESADVLAMPEHRAARRVAEALVENPASERTLEEWADELGVSTKTLMRSFSSDTGTTFGQWRTRARVYRAAQLLAVGWSVQDVAAEVGYLTPTGFIKAYRSVHHHTPAAHAARLRSRSR